MLELSRYARNDKKEEIATHPTDVRNDTVDMSSPRAKATWLEISPRCVIARSKATWLEISPRCVIARSKATWRSKG